MSLVFVRNNDLPSPVSQRTIRASKLLFSCAFRRVRLEEDLKVVLSCLLRSVTATWMDEFAFLVPLRRPFVAPESLQRVA